MSKSQWALCSRHTKGVILLESHEDLVKVELALTFYEQYKDGFHIEISEKEYKRRASVSAVLCK